MERVDLGDWRWAMDLVYLAKRGKGKRSASSIFLTRSCGSTPSARAVRSVESGGLVEVLKEDVTWRWWMCASRWMEQVEIVEMVDGPGEAGEFGEKSGPDGPPRYGNTASRRPGLTSSLRLARGPIVLSRGSSEPSHRFCDLETPRAIARQSHRKCR